MAKARKKLEKVEKVWVFPESYPRTRFIEEAWESFPWRDRMNRNDFDTFVSFFLEQFMNRYPGKENL